MRAQPQRAGAPAPVGDLTSPPRDAIEFIQTFLRVEYPELMAQHKIMRVMSERVDPYVAFTGQYFVRLTNTPSPEGSLITGEAPVTYGERTAPKVFLSATFGFDGTGRLAELHALTSTAKEKLETFGKLVADHPEWSDADALRAFEELGARFGPGAGPAIKKRLELAPFATTWGTIQVTTTPTFRLRVPFGALPEHKYIGMALWSFDVHASQPGKPTRRYRVRVEAFDGGIIDIEPLRPD